jgi:hypothetical protein
VGTSTAIWPTSLSSKPNARTQGFCDFADPAPRQATCPPRAGLVCAVCGRCNRFAVGAPAVHGCRVQQRWHHEAGCRWGRQRPRQRPQPGLPLVRIRGTAATHFSHNPHPCLPLRACNARHCCCAYCRKHRAPTAFTRTTYASVLIFGIQERAQAAPWYEFKTTERLK